MANNKEVVQLANDFINDHKEFKKKIASSIVRELKGDKYLKPIIPYAKTLVSDMDEMTTELTSVIIEGVLEADDTVEISYEYIEDQYKEKYGRKLDNGEINIDTYDALEGLISDLLMDYHDQVEFWVRDYV